MIRSPGVFVAGAAAAVFAIAGGCSDGGYQHIYVDAGNYDAGPQTCVFDSDCTAGFCHAGYCTTCPDTPCDPGLVCTSTGTCIPPDGGLAGNDAGRPDSGNVVRDAGAGDAGCTVSSCGQQACIGGVCKPCTTTGDCGRRGYICNGGNCIPGCSQDSDCTGLGQGYYCNTTNNQCTWGCLPSPGCGSFCCNLGTCDTTSHQCSGFSSPDGGLVNNDGGSLIPDGGFSFPDGGSTSGLCFGGTPPSNTILLFAWFANCGCDLPASCNVCDPVNGCSQSCAPLTGTCCMSSGGFGCSTGSDCCSGVCNSGTCQ